MHLMNVGENVDKGAYKINGFHDVFYVKLPPHGIEKEGVNFLYKQLAYYTGLFLNCAGLHKNKLLY